MPVAYLRVFPLPQKRMAAMSVRVDDRFAVLIAKESKYLAEVAFFLAHELGHVWLGHLLDQPAVIDFEEDTPSLGGDDSEEQAADAFALELLTGRPEPTVLPGDPRYQARDLAQRALGAGPELRIDPGVLLMCFGYSTKDWTGAYAALKFLYGDTPPPIWDEVNRLAWSQSDRDAIPAEGLDFLQLVLGLP
jgi:hypothetical protein